MSDPTALPWSVDPHGLGIWSASLKGGGHGTLGLSGTEAMAVQKSIAERVVRAVNDEPELRAHIQILEAEVVRLRRESIRHITILMNDALKIAPAQPQWIKAALNWIEMEQAYLAALSTTSGKE